MARWCYTSIMNKANDIIQWVGTVFVLAMYTVMNFFPELAPWNIVFGLLGALAYFTWTVRVRNYPQMLINIVAITCSIDTCNSCRIGYGNNRYRIGNDGTATCLQI